MVQSGNFHAGDSNHNSVYDASLIRPTRRGYILASQGGYFLTSVFTIHSAPESIQVFSFMTSCSTSL